MLLTFFSTLVSLPLVALTELFKNSEELFQVSSCSKMSPKYSFALLNLPLVALTEVIKKMELKELFQLSFCSKKSHFIVKHCRDKSIKWKLELRGTSGVRLYLYKPDDLDFLQLNINCFPERKGCSIVKLEGETLKIRFGLIFGLDVYCRDVQCGTNSLLQYVSDLFNKNIDAVFFLKSTCWMMGMVQKLQGSAYNAGFCTNDDQKERFTDEEFRDLLTACKATNLYIQHEPANFFRFDNFAKKYDRLCISYGHWITSNNFFSLNCRELIINRKIFTKKEIGQYLKRWIEGGAPRLKALSVHVGYCKQEELFSNIEKHMLTIPGEQQYQVTNNNWIFNGKLVRRVDGVMASIQYYPEWQCVRLAVWPDLQGNSFC